MRQYVKLIYNNLKKPNSPIPTLKVGTKTLKSQNANAPTNQRASQLFRFQSNHRAYQFFERDATMLKSIFVIIEIIIIIVWIQKIDIFLSKYIGGTKVWSW
jgi:hypothetical protein